MKTIKTNYASSLTQNEETLLLQFTPENNMLKAEGESSGDNIFSTYSILANKVTNHLKTSDSIDCYFNYTSINGSSVKLLFNLFRKLETATSSGKNVTVHWVIENEDDHIYEVGQDLKDLTDLDFRISFAA